MASTSDTLGSMIIYAQIQRELQTEIQLDIVKQTEMQLDGQTDKQIQINIVRQPGICQLGMYTFRDVYSYIVKQVDS